MQVVEWMKFLVRTKNWLISKQIRHLYEINVNMDR